MKRSEINSLLVSSIEFLDKMNFKLPPFAFRKPEEWKGQYQNCNSIIDSMLGWDLTDFGSGDFHRFGLLLFTMRNGNTKKNKKPYTEKVMIIEEMQVTPMHFHATKMEDIINRGGGNLMIDLYNSSKEKRFSSEPVIVAIDGILQTVKPGGTITLTPGESICLENGVYHRFYGEKNKGKVLVGEVSVANDDASDNLFYEPSGRFSVIVEDENPVHLLVSDYLKYI